jgi:hypothetical protein
MPSATATMLAHMRVVLRRIVYLFSAYNSRGESRCLGGESYNYHEESQKLIYWGNQASVMYNGIVTAISVKSRSGARQTLGPSSCEVSNEPTVIAECLRVSWQLLMLRIYHQNLLYQLPRSEAGWHSKST